MRMLQNCNPKNYLLVGAFMLISGCVTQNPAIVGIPAATVETVPASTEAGSDLSTKTVAPEGFDKILGIFTPYRITIQQGNFVSKEMAEQVNLGMTREQVRFLLGTALITDMFHADRWDYIFRLLKPNGELTTSRVTVFFENSLVSKIERGELPNEQEYLQRITDAAIKDSIAHIDRKSDKPKPKKDE